MNRRLALTIAGSAAIVITAGSAAVAANLGILGAASEEPVGSLDANTVAELSTPIPTVEPVVVTLDEIVPVPVEAVPPAPSPTGKGDDVGDAAYDDSSPPPAPTSAVTPTTVRADDSGPGDDDHQDDHDDDGGHGEGDEIEYEDD